MDWNNARIIGSESNKHKRWIKEAIEIGKRAQNTISRDDGAFMLSLIWDSLLQRPLDGGGGDQPDRPVRSTRQVTPTADNDTSQRRQMTLLRKTADNRRNMSR